MNILCRFLEFYPQRLVEEYGAIVIFFSMSNKIISQLSQRQNLEV